MDLPCVSGDVCGNAYVSPCARVPPKVNFQTKENIYAEREGEKTLV